MTGQNTPKPPVTGLPQSAELEFRLETTKERLRQASAQLVELARILLAPTQAAHPASDRYLFNELVLSKMIDEVRDAARELHKARDIASQGGGTPCSEADKLPDVDR